MPFKAEQFMTERHDLIYVEPSNPAAGQRLVWPCPTTDAIQIVSFACRLTTSASGDPRLLYCNLESDSNRFHYSVSPVLQDPNTGVDYWFTVGTPSLDFISDEELVATSLGCCYQLKPNIDFEINWRNIQAGDQLSNIIIYYFRWLAG